MRNIFLKSRGSRQFDGDNFIDPAYRRVRRWALVCALVVLAGLSLARCATLGLNVSESLPHTLYLIHRNAPLKSGDLVAFRWHGNGPYANGVTFVKIVAGVPGDRVTQKERRFFINGHAVGYAKPAGRNGMPLDIGPTGQIPPGQFYVMAPHPDSLDSRYRLTGWISQSQIIGRAHALF